ncbi:hypothetical protein B0H14DRAFT_2573214 [Mycena olivaceomarginata]|nr:hypothetical protein B0H14DRAFT_2573214 [Mycena olivaceomarginata]
MAHQLTHFFQVLDLVRAESPAGTIRARWRRSAGGIIVQDSVVKHPGASVYVRYDVYVYPGLITVDEVSRGKPKKAWATHRRHHAKGCWRRPSYTRELTKYYVGLAGRPGCLPWVKLGTMSPWAPCKSECRGLFGDMEIVARRQEMAEIWVVVGPTYLRTIYGLLRYTVTSAYPKQIAKYIPKRVPDISIAREPPSDGRGEGMRLRADCFKRFEAPGRDGKSVPRADS